MRKTPLLLPAAAVVAGMLVAHFICRPAEGWLWGMAGVALLLGVVLVAFRQVRWPAVALAGMLLFSFAGWRMAAWNADDWTVQCPDNPMMVVKVAESPYLRGKTIRARADVCEINGNRRVGQVRLYLKADSAATGIRYGDRLVMHVFPDLQRQSVYTTSTHYLLLARDSTSLRARSEKIRLGLLHRMRLGPLPQPALALVEALTLGWRADIDPETQGHFRDAGLAHLLAVSGLHVGLLVALVGGLLLPLGKRKGGRIVRGIVQLGVVWTFCLLSGAAPSTQRAALMFSLFVVADITDRRTPKGNLLAFAAMVTLLLRPSLLFDVGWQLSYSAVAGILLARPVIMAFRSRLWQSAMVSLAATCATLPVTITRFQCVPLYFLIANVVVVPLSGLLLGLALLYVAFPCAATAWPVGMLTTAVEWFTGWVASLPGAVLRF